MGKMSQPGTDKGERGETGEKMPKVSNPGRSGRMTNGVAMGKMDNTGSEKNFNSGRTEGVCYTHGRKSYQ